MANGWEKQPQFVGVWLSSWFFLYFIGYNSTIVALLAVGCASLYIADILLKSYDIFVVEQELLKDVADRAVLITGCDSGFGNKLAKRLSIMGFKVYAGCLQPDGCGAEDLSKSESIKVVKMDITKQDDVDEVFKIVEEDLKRNSLELWAIVNNAGISGGGLVELVSMDTYRHVMEVNTFGPVRVTKAFLPLLRAAKRGRVVNVASQAGRFTCFSFSPYCMSKHALVAFSDGLRMEMQTWNISVHTIEPGLYKTDICNIDRAKKYYKDIWENGVEEVKKAYGKVYHEAVTEGQMNLIESGKPACKVYEVTDDLVDAVASVNPKIRYTPGMDTKMWTRVLREMPFELIDLFWLKRAATNATPAEAP